MHLSDRKRPAREGVRCQRLPSHLRRPIEQSQAAGSDLQIYARWHTTVGVTLFRAVANDHARG